ncbi:hypothetical protein BBOR36S_03595 [Brevibacillus borstelensis]
MISGFGGKWSKWDSFRFALLLIFVAPFLYLFAQGKKLVKRITHR